MSVVKGKRNQSKFEAFHHFFKLRDEITAMILNDFGFSFDKQEKKRQKFAESHKDAANLDEIMKRWHTKNDTFIRWFIDEEGKAVMDIMRNIQREFTIANSIFPSETPARLIEFLERRRHINNAIGQCYALKQEINYVIRTLPVDMNRYVHFAEEIDEQINLFRGVRKADNRLIKPKREIKEGSIKDHSEKLFTELNALLLKLGEMEGMRQGDL